MSPLRVVVVGAGAFGASAALELRRRGHDVALLDAGPLPHPDAASTDVSKLVRMDYGRDAFYAELAETAIEAWEAWNAASPDPLYHPDGFLLLGSAPLRPGGFEHDSWATLGARGHPLERLDAGQLAARFPAWAAGRYGRQADGYYNPRAGWAESARAVRRLLADCRAAGVRLHEGERFVRLLDRGSRVAGMEAADARFEGDVVVMATGAWTPALLPWLQDVMWATGQPVLLFRPADPSPFRPQVFPPWAADIATTGRYGFPALPDGTVKLGWHGPGRRVDPLREPRVVGRAEVDAARAFLVDALPALADAPLAGTRLCLYCDTFDSDFWIGQDPAREGLVVAAGGSGHGFKFAPVLGTIIADVVEGRDNRWAERFRWRAPGERRTEHARAI